MRPNHAYQPVSPRERRQRLDVLNHDPAPGQAEHPATANRRKYAIGGRPGGPGQVGEVFLSQRDRAVVLVGQRDQPGSDGVYVYVLDKCGLRRVDPTSGATYTLVYPSILVANGQWPGPSNITSAAIAGQYGYLIVSGVNSSLVKVDLANRVVTTMLSNAFNNSPVIAADAANVWVHADSNAINASLYRFNRAGRSGPR